MNQQDRFVAWAFGPSRWRVWKVERRVRRRYRVRLRLAIDRAEKKRLRAERKHRILRIHRALTVVREHQSPYSLYHSQSVPTGPANAT